MCKGGRGKWKDKGPGINHPRKWTEHIKGEETGAGRVGQTETHITGNL